MYWVLGSLGLIGGILLVRYVLKSAKVSPITGLTSTEGASFADVYLRIVNRKGRIPFAVVAWVPHPTRPGALVPILIFCGQEQTRGDIPAKNLVHLDRAVKLEEIDYARESHMQAGRAPLYRFAAEFKAKLDASGPNQMSLVSQEFAETMAFFDQLYASDPGVLRKAFVENIGVGRPSQAGAPRSTDFIQRVVLPARPTRTKSAVLAGAEAAEVIAAAQATSRAHNAR